MKWREQTTPTRCNCNWMNFDYQFSETVHFMCIYVFSTTVFSVFFALSLSFTIRYCVSAMHANIESLFNDKKSNVMNGNGYWLTRIAKCIEMKSKSKFNTNNSRDFMDIHNVQCNIKYVPQQKESREWLFCVCGVCDKPNF